MASTGKIFKKQSSLGIDSTNDLGLVTNHMLCMTLAEKPSMMPLNGNYRTDISRNDELHIVIGSR